MALSIKNEEADRLARELAATTGETLTDAVVVALRERLARERARQGVGVADRLRRLAAEVAERERLDDRPPEAIVGYDADGLPRLSGVVVDTSAAVAVLFREAGPE